MYSELPVGPTDLRDFFKSQGWNLFEQAVKDRLFVFSHPSYPRRQLIFPMDLYAPDYEEAVSQAIHKVADLTGTTDTYVRNRIKTAKDDVLRLRVFFDGNDTELPLSFASVLVQSTEKMLRTAACTVLRPRLHHPRLTLNEAVQFVNQAKFGQTERGSFVLNVACPINSMEVQGELGFDDPFVRQVTASLNKALWQLKDAIETDRVGQLIDSLKDAPAPLVSSNLCEAIGEMHDEQVNNSLDFAFDWSLLRQAPVDDRQRRVVLQRDYFARVEEIRRELRRHESAQEETFIGTVEKLEGDMGEDGRRAGPVVVALLLPEEGETVRARMILSADDYATADKAHMTNGAYVAVRGKLRPGRQPRQLTDIESFKHVGNL